MCAGLQPAITENAGMLFTPIDRESLHRLRTMDLDQLTPIEALTLLAALKTTQLPLPLSSDLVAALSSVRAARRLAGATRQHHNLQGHPR
jgi:hypothetical protein